MFGSSDQDSVTRAFGELAARKDPVIDGFIQFLRDRTPEEKEFIANQLLQCAAAIQAAKERKKED